VAMLEFHSGTRVNDHRRPVRLDPLEQLTGLHGNSPF
jgi:hypothetical protein